MPAEKPKVVVQCSACGKSMQRLPPTGRATKFKNAYCSRACTAKGHRTGFTFQCRQCREKVYRSKLEYTRRGIEDHFCSRTCYFAFRAAKRKETTYLKCGLGHAHLHRVVAAVYLGRALKKGEVVHHIDFDRSNNDPSNLAVFPSQSHHARCHQAGMTKAELRTYALVPSKVK